VAVQADGKVLLGGDFTSLNPGGAGAVTRNRIARLNANGTLDTGFDPRASSLVYSVAVQADGKVLLGGTFTALNPGGAVAVARNRIARVNSDGTLDTGFDPNADNVVFSVAVQTDGKVLLGGGFTSLNPGGTGAVPRNSIARMNTNGTLDTGFDPRASGLVYSVAVQADGKVLLGGTFTSLNPGYTGVVTRNHIARVNADGTLDAGFNPNANGIVFSVAVQADGKVLLGGAFTTLQPNGAPAPTPRTGFARLLNDAASLSLSVPDSTQVNWTRGGSSPELSRVTFELSTDGGASWSALGDGVRVGTTPNWRITGLSLPSGGHIRARGVATGGRSNSLVEKAGAFSFATISIGDASVSEGYLSGSTMRFPVSLSAPLGAPVSVNYATTNGTALAGSDYTTTTGTLTFAAGEVIRFVDVPVLGDAVAEPNETFTLNLSGSSILDGIGVGTILNDDSSTLSVTDYRIAEGTGAGTTNLVFTVITSATSASPITVQYATANGTATTGSDYTSAAGTLTIPANVASLAVSVPVTRDATVEPDETVLLNLSNPTGATIFDSQGVGTIVADDGLLVSISDKTTDEGNAGFTPINFTVTLSAPAPGTVTVDYATADGTATSPLDYTAANGTVSFAIGESSKTVTVQVVGETGQEPYETFLVNLSNATGGATIGDGQGQGTITNTDGATDRSRLMFHNFVTNRLYRWHMKNGNTLDTFNWVTPWATDAGWTVGAVADFDQDGQLDYLWHNVNDGRLLFWYIDGDSLKGFQFLPYTMGPPWIVATTFDADGNGTQDIAYYNSTTGVARVMQHDNATVLGQYDIATLLPGTGTLRVVAAGDANNDGDDELILFNSATGQIQAWNVSGATVASTINYPDTQVTSPAYNLVSTKTDFNNDGLKDLLWHNPTPTGVFSVWFMNGTTRIGTGVFQPFSATDPVWKVVGSANLW
jgi:uncharacterized delta-60 repeat protein